MLTMFCSGQHFSGKSECTLQYMPNTIFNNICMQNSLKGRMKYSQCANDTEQNKAPKFTNSMCRKEESKKDIVPRLGDEATSEGLGMVEALKHRVHIAGVTQVGKAIACLK